MSLILCKYCCLLKQCKKCECGAWACGDCQSGCDTPKCKFICTKCSSVCASCTDCGTCMEHGYLCGECGEFTCDDCQLTFQCESCANCDGCIMCGSCGSPKCKCKNKNEKSTCFTPPNVQPPQQSIASETLNNAPELMDVKLPPILTRQELEKELDAKILQRSMTVNIPLEYTDRDNSLRSYLAAREMLIESTLRSREFAYKILQGTQKLASVFNAVPVPNAQVAKESSMPALEDCASGKKRSRHLSN